MPNAVHDVRVPIGMCFYNLSMENEAKVAFEAALEKDPNNATVISFLASIDLNNSKSKDLDSDDRKKLIKTANQKILQAHKLDPRNSVTSLHLAKKFFDKDLAKAYTMASSAILYNSNPMLEAEALAVKGMIAQSQVFKNLIQSNYDEAFDYFQSAEKINPNSTLILHSLGQMYIYKGLVLLIR
jgi:tetratricopeptide (TPR) repeat protein